jgi:hypothetical protein
MSAGHAYARQRAPRAMTARTGRTAYPIRRAPRRPPEPSRWWPTLFGGVACCALSFAITFQVIKPRPPSNAAATLAHAFVSDSHSLITALRAAGLRGSQNVRGAIQAITAVGNNRISLTGWADEAGNGRGPLDILVFVDGENKLTLQTEGKHADATRGLSDAATTRTASFKGSLTCARGQKLIVVAVDENGDYGYFSPRVCP